jgi:hydrogenase expression/formation protein HypD
MLDLQAFRSEPQARALVDRIRSLAAEDVALMEVCGTHTVAISRYGIRSMLPATVRLLSGPGCPVCVTPLAEIDRAIAAARLPEAIVATFGDMMRVPGSTSSLERERAEGADIRVVYSPLDALSFAEQNPDREVVFLGVGFETTSPTIGATLVEAKSRGVANLSVLPFFKTVPPALDMLASVPGRALDGFICPGHVSAVIGSDAYLPVAGEHNMPCVVTGFEPLDILAGVVMLLEQVRDVRRGGRARVQNQYARAVTQGGNPEAKKILSQVFETCDAEWREIGVIPRSGLRLSESYRTFDAREKLELDVPTPRPVAGCICGEIMLGRALPTDCPIFGHACTPRDPVGPCMVSTEGACAAFYKYERQA